MRHLLVPLLALTTLAQAQNVASLPLLYDPLTPIPKQKFTPQERKSLGRLIQSLNRRSTPAIQKALRINAAQPWCGPIKPEDAALSFTAPFRTARPEKLEVVLVCEGVRNAVSLTFTQAGRRTTYLLPPEEGGGGEWGIRSVYTVRDLNGDGWRELALLSYGAGDVSASYGLKILSFTPSGPRLLANFDNLYSNIGLSAAEGGGGTAQVLRVQKGKIPIVYAQEYERLADSNRWTKTGKVTRTALVSNPVQFMVWP